MCHLRYCPRCEMTSSAVSFGECMVELSRDRKREWRVGYAGDTYNTAVYLSRLGIQTSYLTAIGVDPFSVEMRSAWAADEIDSSLALVDPDRAVGIYAIETADNGERS